MRIPAPVRDLLDRPVLGGVVKGVAAAVGFYAALKVLFDPPIGSLFNGLANGALYGLIGVGVVLIYRTNRIINFAAAALGAVPGILFALLLTVKGWSWYVCFPAAIVGGALLGGLVDVLVIRRFSKAPRLILTVATIGITQILAFVGLLIPVWLGHDGRPISYVPTPFKTFMRFSIGNQRFSGDYPFTLVAVVVVVLALGAFLRYTRLGIALRASAENADRASLLGIPVRTVGTVSWVLAGALASVVIFQRAALVGAPVDGSLGPKVLLFALTAAVIGRMESMITTLVAGLGIGMLAEAAVTATGKDSLASAIMLAVILAALLLQRGRLARAYDTGVSTWQSVREFRPIPLELRHLPEVRTARGVMGLLALAFLLAFPWIVGEGRVGFTHLIIITAIVAVSLVILTGWAGQISLGQFGIVGVGASLAGKMAASHAGADFFLTLVVGALAGALVAVLVGLPALRIQGLYLAVTTLAFGAAMQYYFLDRSYWIGQRLLPDPDADIAPPLLWGRIELTNDLGRAGRPYYYVCLAVLALVVLMARAYRRNRAGRAVVAVRENVRAAGSYSVNPARTKLGAFAVSGAIAGLAGVLLVYQQGAVDPGTYGIGKSLEVFVVTVIGGLTSIMGAVYGAVIVQGMAYFGADIVRNVFGDGRSADLVARNLALVLTGPGLIVTLMTAQGGLAENLYKVRDGFLRRVADKHGLVVPSLFADRRIETGEAETHVIAEAESTVEAAAEMEHTKVGAGS